MIAGGFIKEIIASFHRKSVNLNEQRDRDLKHSIEICEEISSISIDEWCLAGDNEDSTKRCASITARLHCLGLINEQLFCKFIEQKRKSDIALIRLRKVVTGGEFGSKSREEMPEYTAEIEIAIFEFLHAIKTLRRKLPSGLFK